jgi:hypothetical protein
LVGHAGIFELVVNSTLQTATKAFYVVHTTRTRVMCKMPMLQCEYKYNRNTACPNSVALIKQHSGRGKIPPAHFHREVPAGGICPHTFSPRNSGRGKMPPTHFHRGTPTGGKCPPHSFTAELRPGENAPRTFSPQNCDRGKMPAHIFTAKFRPGENAPRFFTA